MMINRQMLNVLLVAFGVLISAFALQATVEASVLHYDNGDGEAPPEDNLILPDSSVVAPEPATLGLLATGLLGAALLKRRSK
ncbi:MAG: PEP-CTERM sorting domain-containing protein [Candidatus Omnitrophica bacterium]|nr:PEP-CTERM sorting domain-containing protein [Candidatus Omnitrophota bacterium]